METEIVCTLIQAAGTVVAALGTAIIARVMIQKDIKPIFQSYSDKSYDLSDILGRARHNIVIMGASGYRILKEYGSVIEKKLNRGVSLYYLFLNEQQLLAMERYRHGGLTAADRNIYAEVKEILGRWREKFGKQLQVREFSQFMTAAYVGVDIPFGKERLGYSSDSVIQVVVYQYGNSAKDSPLTRLTPKRDKRHFEGTIDPMAKMWSDAKEIC